jgi:hypothetical protein
MTKPVGAVGSSFVYETPKGLNGPTGAVPELPVTAEMIAAGIVACRKVTRIVACREVTSFDWHDLAPVIYRAMAAKAPDRLPPVFMGTPDISGVFQPRSFVPCDPGYFVPCGIDPATPKPAVLDSRSLGKSSLLNEALARIAELEDELLAAFEAGGSQAKWPEPDSIYDDPVWSGTAFELAQANPCSDHLMKQALQAALNQRDAARSRIAELEGMIRPGCSKTPSPEGGGHLIWWPDKMPVPQFNADETAFLKTDDLLARWNKIVRDDYIDRIAALEAELASLRSAFSDPAPADLPDPPRRPDGTLAPQPKPWTPPKQSEPQRRVGG